MSDETARGDDVYQPANSDADNRPTDDLDMENALGGREADEMQVEGYSPPDQPLAVTKHGTTGEEQREGETLDQRLAEEVPDVQPPVGDQIGDLPEGEGELLEGTAPQRDTGVPGQDAGMDGAAAPAEEAAMHIDFPEDNETL
ncbi:DUF5709 domain-containing protein [Streptomyces sp. NPDC003016]